MADQKKKKDLYKKLRNKYRMVVMNDETFEEKFSLKLTPMNVFVLGGIVIITLITIVIYTVAFTPLREYIPGYADVSMQRKVISLGLKADSLEKALAIKDVFIENFKAIVNGTVGDSDSISGQQKTSPVRFDTMKTLPKSQDDSTLRAMVESESQYDLSLGSEKNYFSNISSFFFFTPIKGTVVNAFNPKEKHYGTDIVAPPNEPIKATLDGTVILANWTSETGYIIGIQHSNNMFSLYKHNSVLLKKTGTYVKAGDPIAIIGNSGELTSGPHLHFELWYNGSPIDPQKYMTF